MITKDSRNLAGIDYCQGEVILIDKEIDKTSFNVIYKIRKTINIQKIGHAGTLDPRATGLLIVCTGKKTKEIEKFQSLEKNLYRYNNSGQNYILHGFRNRNS